MGVCDIMESRGDSRETLTLLGTSQDGGLPQAGCSCKNCYLSFKQEEFRRFPVSLGLRDSNGSMHLIEATRSLPDQLMIWAEALGLDEPVRPDSVIVTHAHLGHIEGLGQFGKEVMGCLDLPLFASNSVIEVIKQKGFSLPFKINSFQGENNCKIELPGIILEFIPVPHRDDVSDTHAILIVGENNRILFLPDHDDWDQTLTAMNCESPREWFNSLELTHALIDATFWSNDELGGRDMSQIPHPLVTDTMERLGDRIDSDPEIIFIHLNHTNPLNDQNSKERKIVIDAGWKIGEEGWHLKL